MLAWEKDNTITKNRQKYAFRPCVNKRSYLTNQFEYGDVTKYLNSSRDKEHVGTQFLKIGATTAQLSPPLNPVSFLISAFLYQVL